MFLNYICISIVTIIAENLLFIFNFIENYLKIIKFRQLRQMYVPTIFPIKILKHENFFKYLYYYLNLFSNN